MLVFEEIPHFLARAARKDHDLVNIGIFLFNVMQSMSPDVTADCKINRHFTSAR